MPWVGTAPPRKVGQNPQYPRQPAFRLLPTPWPSDTPKAALHPGEAGEAGVQGAGRARAWESEGLSSGPGAGTGWACDARYVT